MCGCATAQVVRHWLPTVQAWPQTQSTPCWICIAQRSIMTDIFPSTSVFSCQSSFSNVQSCHISPPTHPQWAGTIGPPEAAVSIGTLL